MIDWEKIVGMFLLAIAVMAVTITGCMVGDEFLHAGSIGVAASGSLAAILWISSVKLWAGGFDK